MSPKYPGIKVKLLGEDGNAFAIMGKVRRAIQDVKGREEADVYIEEATLGDYDNLLRVTMEWVEVE